jgi:N6-adenosine-specific RNA methylase IME4/ParB-like chromosome segregation protein Spo0J
MTNSDPYQVLPPLSADDFAALKSDIATRGIMVPVEYDQDGNVIDGHHRVKACQELGIANWPRIVRSFKSESDKWTHARQLNLARRHLTQEQRRGLIEAELRQHPGRSNRQIATSLGVDDTTVGDARRRLESTAGFPQLKTAIGADGKARPVHPPKIAAIDLGSDGERAIRVAAKAQRAERVEERRQERIQRFAAINQNNTDLPTGVRFPVGLADVAWRYETYDSDAAHERGPGYPTITVEEACAYGPQMHELFTDSAVLFFWTTSAHLRVAFDVIDAWGFTYSTCGVWVKTECAPGLGHFLRQQHELLLIARRGDFPLPPPETRPSSVISAPRREHSRKPDEVHSIIERMYPDVPKVELFARQQRQGWVAWGNQLAPAVAMPREPEPHPLDIPPFLKRTAR